MDHNNQLIFDMAMSLAWERVVDTRCMPKTKHIPIVYQIHSVSHQGGILISGMHTTGQG